MWFFIRLLDEIMDSVEEFEMKHEENSFSQGDYWSKERLSSLISLYFEERDLWDTTRTPTLDQKQEAYERIANSVGCDGWCAVFCFEQ